MRKIGLTGLIGLGVAIVAGCGGQEQRLEDAARKAEEAGKKMEAAAKAGGEGLGDAMKAMGDAVSGVAGKKVETVDFRELKALLPESLPGMKRTEATGEKNAAFGMGVSEARGRYESEAGASVGVKIVDIGSVTGLAGMAAYAWAAAEVDRETDSGYEKTTTFGGYKAHEKYDRQAKSGELSVLVAGRFIVEIDGSDVDVSALKAAMGKIDLAKLDGMKLKGVQ